MEQMVFLKNKQPTRTLLHEERNSDYSNTTLVIADLVWELMVIFQLSRLSLFIEQMVFLKDKQPTRTLLHEVRNSNYSNTRLVIADLASGLMVVCQWTHDLGNCIFIFRFYLIQYEIYVLKG